MNTNKLTMVLLLGLIPGNAMAAMAGISNCMGSACIRPDATANELPANCSRYTEYCYQGTMVYNCTQCDTGYKLNGFTVEVNGCANQIDANGCMQDCTGCTNCTSDTSWSAGNTGYEKKVTRTCDCNTCRTSTSYRCAAGYYGSSTNGTSGCTQCPQASGVYSNSGLTTLIRGTSVAGSTAQTSCYIPSGTVFYDSTGSGKYDGDSYYCN